VKANKVTTTWRITLAGTKVEALEKINHLVTRPVRLLFFGDAWEEMPVLRL